MNTTRRGLTFAALAISILLAMVLITPQGRAFAHRMFQFFTTTDERSFPIPTDQVSPAPETPTPPPAQVLPAVARAAVAVAGPRVGLLRSIFFEVTSQSPEALDGTEPRIRQALGAIGGYFARQMAAGQLRQMHPLLAAQLFMGPMVFHLITRAELDRLGLADNLPLAAAIDQLSEASLRALT